MQSRGVSQQSSTEDNKRRSVLFQSLGADG